jgi:hypothetical protein
MVSVFPAPALSISNEDIQINILNGGNASWLTERTGTGRGVGTA